MAVIDVFIYNALFLEQSTDTNFKILKVEHHLVLDDDTQKNLKVEGVKSLLFLKHSLVLAKSIDVSVEHALTFVDGTLPRVWPEVASHHLAMMQDVILVGNWPSVTQTLSFTQEATVETAKGTFSTLSLAHAVDVQVTRNLAIEQVVDFLNEATGYLPSYYWTSFDVVLEAP